jgi:Domain of unknown function (DUF6430)
MSDLLRAYFSRGYWLHDFSVLKAIEKLLLSFGTLWLLVEITTFFSQEAATWLKSQWATFLILGIALSLLENRPRHRISCRLAIRDVLIEIRVGDLFQIPGSLVIGCNTTFDTDIESGIISAKSLQGQFTKKFYNSVHHMNADLEEELKNIPPKSQDHFKRGMRNIYPIGTTVKLRTKTLTTYLVAIAHLNFHGNAQSSFEGLKSSLPCLWEFISTQGDFGSIVMPVLGSGFARIPESREVIIREILQSFIAACADHRPCETLTIVIPANDFYRHQVNLADLEAFIHHICKYSEFADSKMLGRGEAVPL